MNISFIKQSILASAAILTMMVSCQSKNTPGNSPEPGPIPVSKGAYKHVVIIGVDGGGAFFKDTSTPRVDEIFAKGASTYRSKTSYPTISAQCWGSMLHGVLPEFHGITNSIAKENKYPKNSPYPSIFRVVREAMPEAKLASFCNWDAINNGIIESNLGVEMGTGNDSEVTRKIVNYLTENTPTLLFVQFDSADGAGHGFGYGSQDHLAAISVIDALIGRIYDQIKLKGFLEETLFIVSADHGGTPSGSNGGQGGTHGGDTEAERYVFLGVLGKTVENGTIEGAETRDIAAIAAYALGVDAPETWTGHVPSGVFKGVTAGERIEIEPSENRKHETVPTPKVSHTQELLHGHSVIGYFPFDETSLAAIGNVQTVENGKLYYSDAYFGKGISLDDGYITLKDVKVGKESFSISFWIKTTGVSGDPSIISNKDWSSGKNSGFILSLRTNQNYIRFNAGIEKKNRMDYLYDLPYDYKDGWMHVIVTVDRVNNKIRLYYDFTLTSERTEEGKESKEGEIIDELKDVAFDALDLNIGQDGTGAYENCLAAQLDEFIITADVLDENDVKALQQHYQANQ